MKNRLRRLNRRISPLDTFHEIIVTPEQAKVLHTLNTITTDSLTRATIGILTNGTVQAATNGFALLAIQSSEPMPDELQGLKIIDTEGRIIRCKNYDGQFKYPDLTAVIPTSKPVFSLSLDQDLLRYLLEILSALSDPYHGVTLNFYGDNRPFEIVGYQRRENGKEIGSYALMMPMVHEDYKPHRPDWINQIKPPAPEDHHES